MTYCLVTFSLLALFTAILGVDADCTSNVDCTNNFDCVWLGFFQGRHCLPKTCTEGAVRAMIDEGFDPQKWVDDITAKAGLRGRNFFEGISNKEAVTLQEAYETATPPPMDAFARYYEACTNPKSDADRVAIIRSTFVYHGLQWGIGAGCLYTGKSFWVNLVDDTTLQVILNCIGFFLGAQVGAASYVARLETWNTDLDDPSTWPQASGSSNDPTTPDYLCVPTAMVGPLQVTFCWDGSASISIETAYSVEVSVGGQFGAGLGGLQACYAEFSCTGPSCGYTDV